MVELFNRFRIQMALMCETDLHMDQQFQPELTAPALKDLLPRVARWRKKKREKMGMPKTDLA